MTAPDVAITAPPRAGNGSRNGVGHRPPPLYTDAGNARRLVEASGHELRWVPQWGTWLTWDGARWKVDTKGVVVERAKAVAHALYAQAVLTTSEERRAAIKWALASESAGRIDAMIRLARSEPGISVDADELDAYPWLFNVSNGTVDLTTGQLLRPDPTWLLTKLSPVDFDEEASCPRWLEFLDQVLPDREVQEFLRRAVGYTLTGITTEQVLFFAHGNGANGKSTFLESLAGVMGDYARQADPELLLNLGAVTAHPTGTADLQGARLVVCSEIDEGRRLAEAKLKRLTGGDKISARRMRENFFEFAPTHKLWLQANHRPVIRGTDYAVWRRLRLVPFLVTIPSEERDKFLARRLAEEAAGILAWAVGGCVAWRSYGLSSPVAVTAATESYRAEMDVLADFIEEYCRLGEEYRAAAADLYKAYTTWCADSGERPMSQHVLGAMLTERGFDRRKYGPTRRWHWFGVGLEAAESRVDNREVNP